MAKYTIVNDRNFDAVKEQYSPKDYFTKGKLTKVRSKSASKKSKQTKK